MFFIGLADTLITRHWLLCTQTKRNLYVPCPEVVAMALSHKVAEQCGSGGNAEFKLTVPL